MLRAGKPARQDGQGQQSAAFGGRQTAGIEETGRHSV